MAADGSLGANDHHLTGLAGGRGTRRAGLDDAHHGNAGSLGNLVESQRGGRVAGDHQHLGAVLFEILRRADGVPGNGFGRLRAVGQPRRVAEVDVIGVGGERDQFFEDGQSAKAGIKYADAGSSSGGHEGCEQTS